MMLQQYQSSGTPADLGDNGLDEASDNTPLHRAADSGDEAAVRTLLENRAPRNTTNCKGVCCNVRVGVGFTAGDGH